MKSKHLLLMLLLALFVPWAANAQEYLTVYENETSTNGNVPVWGTWADNSLKCEILYPASELEAMAGGEISALKFYANSTSLNIGTESASNNWNGTFTIFMKEVEATTLSAFTDGAGAVTVLEGAKIGVVNGEMTIEFSDNYTYEGGNLLLGVYYTTGGQYKSATWYGKSMGGASIYGRSGQSYSASPGNFIPRTTFTYEAASQSDCEKPETVTASQITPNTAMLNWEGGSTPGNGYNVEIKGGQYDDWTPYASNISQGCQLTQLIENTAYQVRVQVVCSATETSSWKTASFTTPAYFSNFNVAIVPGEGNKAVFSWTENGFTPSEWQLCINGDEENLISMTSNPFTYDGLTPEVATTAKMRAFVGNNNTGAWSNTVTFTPTDSYLITLNEGTNLHTNVPITGSYCDYGNRSQFIIPAADLASIQWAKLDKLTFYSNNAVTGTNSSNVPYFEGTVFEVYLAEVSNTIFESASFVDWSTLTKVYNGTLVYSGKEWTFEFDNSYTYSGGNLLIGFYETSYTTAYTSISWLGVTQATGVYSAVYQTASSSHAYSGNPTRTTFLPKVTITFTPGEEPSCLPITNLSLSRDYDQITATWEGSAASYNIDINGTVTEGVTSPYVFTAELSTAYTVKVQADCDEAGTSDWSNEANITTPECWGGHIIEYSLTDSYNDGWNGASITFIEGCNKKTLTCNGGSTSGTLVICEDYFAFVWNSGSYDSECGFTFTEGGTTLFTKPSPLTDGLVLYTFGEQSCVTPTGLAAGTPEKRSVELNWTSEADAWQICVNGDEDNLIDVTEKPYTLPNLTPATAYTVKIRTNCGDEQSCWSDEINFTTALACPAPTNLAPANVKSTQVDLSWTNGGAEDWVLAYKEATAEEFTELNLGLNDVTIEGTTVTYTLTGLDEETQYVVKVQDNCEASYAGDGQSAWTATTSFTTMAACAVDNVTVSNIGHYTATVDWNGESNNGYTVKYREAAGIDGSREDFSDSSIPSDWSLNYGLVDDVVSGSATLTTSSSYNWKMVTAASNVFNSNHVTLNIYGTSVKNWLVSPSFTLAANSTMSFDLALTAYSYNGSSTSAASGTCLDDRFAVLIYADNAWHILREWNNEDGATYVFNNIATAGETVSDIDISEYYGKTVQFAFYGESTVTSNGDNDLHIDNVQIGLPVAEGEWQPVNANENTANLSQLTPGTKYDLTVVPNCDETLASEIQQFSTVSENQKWFITEGDWGTAANWEPEGAPTVDQTVELRANVTIESGCVALAKTINKGNYSITVEDGGQLKYYNNSAISATVKKNIAAWTIEESNDVELSDGWYLIANPITSNFTPTAENGFYAGNYDLYSWNYAATDGNEWLNFKVTSNSLTYLNSSNYNSYGYLYANEQGTVLTYEGNVKPANSNLYRSVTAPSTPSNYAFPGWFLMGNGYLCTAYVASASVNGEGKPYYRMNTNHNGFEAATAGTPLAPMEGFFYEATSISSTSIYVTPNKPNNPSKGQLNMNLRKGTKQLDNAIVVFGGEQSLGKMSFRENSSKIYIPMDGKDFAIVSTESVGELPVNFKAAKNGNYTLGFNTQDIDFSYLHLIDNLTGVETDLLETPSYSFEAKTTDYASRFTLVFATGNNNEDNFAYFSNGNFVINNEGNATLQVVDVMGRIVKSQNINGCANVNVNAAPGVYMLRLVNGNDVKVQKVVVR